MTTARFAAGLAGALVMTLSAFSTIASAQTSADKWPNRPVRFIVPLGPGSGVDVTARMIADRLATKWGQPVVVENRPGGDSIVAITAVITGNDDHLLLMAPASSFTAHPYLHEKLPYKYSDLTPVARVSNTIVTVAVPAASGVTSIKALVEQVKAQPGKLNWATATGANDLMFAGWLKKAGLDMVKMPYRNSVDAVSDLAENRVHAYVAAYAIVRPRVEGNKVRILALSNSKRVPDMNTPTAIEEGYPELTLDGLVGLLGPKEMPAAVAEKIAADIAVVMKDPEIASKVTATGQVVSPGSPKEFADEINAQRETVAKIGASLGIKPAAE